MTKKISSTGKYLGISQDWFLNFQFYGKFYLYFFSSFFSFYKLLNIVYKKTFNNKLLIFKVNINFCFKLVNFYLGFIFLKLDINLVNLFFKNINQFLFNNFLETNLTFYFKNINQFSKKFLEMYLEYLSLNYSPKKIFNLLVVFLRKKINNTNVLYLNSGVKKVQLKGFKVQLKGRYELSKSTLSKKQFFKFGKVTSNNLNNLLQFSNKIIYSKLGLSTIKIWYFYL